MLVCDILLESLPTNQGTLGRRTRGQLHRTLPTVKFNMVQIPHLNPLKCSARIFCPRDADARQARSLVVRRTLLKQSRPFAAAKPDRRIHNTDSRGLLTPRYCGREWKLLV